MPDPSVTDRDAPATHPLHGTCDACGGGPPVRFANPDDPNGAYICQECDAWHERALDAAVAASLGHARGLNIGQIRALLSVGVKAYCEYPGDDEVVSPGDPQ